MTMTLASITLQGSMQGPIWWPAGQVCETEFCRDFMPPKGQHSPWATDWINLDEALQEALSTGDFCGGMGELVTGQIVFRMGDGRGKLLTISKPLETLSAAKPYLAPED